MSNIYKIGNTYNVACFNKISPTFLHNNHRFKAGVITINSCNISINSSDSVYTVANKINAVSNKCKVIARVTFNGRLILETKNHEINITDHNQVLFNYYKSGMLGIHKHCLIQGVRTHSNIPVRINYPSAKVVNQQRNATQSYFLDEAAKHTLASQENRPIVQQASQNEPVVMAKPKLSSTIITKVIHSRISSITSCSTIASDIGENEFDGFNVCESEYSELAKDDKTYIVAEFVDLLQNSLKNVVLDNLESLGDYGEPIESSQFNDSLEKDILNAADDVPIENFLTNSSNIVSRYLLDTINLDSAYIQKNAKTIIAQILSRSYYTKEYLDWSDYYTPRLKTYSKPYHHIGHNTLEWLAKLPDSLHSKENQRNEKLVLPEINKNSDESEFANNIMDSNNKKKLSNNRKKSVDLKTAFLLSELHEIGMTEIQKRKWHSFLYDNFDELYQKSESEIEDLVSSEFKTIGSDDIIKKFLSVFSEYEQQLLYDRLKPVHLDHIVKLGAIHDLSSHIASLS